MQRRNRLANLDAGLNAGQRRQLAGIRGRALGRTNARVASNAAAGRTSGS